MEATRRLRNSANPSDTLFGANDLMAIGALNAVAGEMGMRAGNEISVIGFDNIAMASWPLINLTTWVQSLREMVAHVMSVLNAQRLDATAPPVQHGLQEELILRGSSRQPWNQTGYHPANGPLVLLCIIAVLLINSRNNQN
ncbi:substrate-binding domain-containing protein [[Erwinia] mediterraneensis]|uniref:substrate-binding domain-containing protein n=1 Tax=[Erwinia] mediterraneensis TaxID=2161819 RepID=UPI0010300158|nr:substrate-binding domain-containing protein [[Erwinia] mediterraneensis]